MDSQFKAFVANLLGQDYKDIAKQFGVALPTIKNQVARAKAILGQKLLGFNNEYEVLSSSQAQQIFYREFLQLKNSDCKRCGDISVCSPDGFCLQCWIELKNKDNSK